MPPKNPTVGFACVWVYEFRGVWVKRTKGLVLGSALELGTKMMKRKKEKEREAVMMLQLFFVIMYLYKIFQEFSTLPYQPPFAIPTSRPSGGANLHTHFFWFFFKKKVKASRTP